MWCLWEVALTLFRLGFFGHPWTRKVVSGSNLVAVLLFYSTRTAEDLVLKSWEVVLVVKLLVVVKSKGHYCYCCCPTVNTTVASFPIFSRTRQLVRKLKLELEAQQKQTENKKEKTHSKAATTIPGSSDKHVVYTSCHQWSHIQN